ESFSIPSTTSSREHALEVNENLFSELGDVWAVPEGSRWAPTRWEGRRCIDYSVFLGHRVEFGTARISDHKAIWTSFSWRASLEPGWVAKPTESLAKPTGVSAAVWKQVLAAREAEIPDSTSADEWMALYRMATAVHHRALHRCGCAAKRRGVRDEGSEIVVDRQEDRGLRRELELQRQLQSGRRADAAMLRDGSLANLRQEEQIWHRDAQCEELERLAGNLTREQAQPAQDWQLQASGLHAAAAAKRECAVGPDRWSCAEIHAWPEHAWHIYLDIWQRWASRDQWPAQLSSYRQVFLAKDQGEGADSFRPISIQSVFNRVIATAMARQ
ncbi:ccdc135, partial [Symbiodinium sp. KB8]